tara:strand:+ start:979 stop:1263 length:285 start_codon:yes stop_codon:yes gene_type:complete
MGIHITEHAQIRFIERAMGLDLTPCKEQDLKDHAILEELKVDREKLQDKMLGDKVKLMKILAVMASLDSKIIIGVSDTHRLVFIGRTIVTVLPN